MPGVGVALFACENFSLHIAVQKLVFIAWRFDTGHQGNLIRSSGGESLIWLLGEGPVLTRPYGGMLVMQCIFVRGQFI